MDAKTPPHAPTALGSADSVSAEDVVKVFGSGTGAVRALDGVSVTIAAGEFFTLLGPSGCGKTTLLRLIAGFEHPTAGTIRLEGAEISHLPPHKRPVNTVFQSYALFPHMSVAQNIGFGLAMLGRDTAEVERTVREMLALVKMETLADRLPSQISGGQQQRVALARALAPRPKVLLLDEPLSALDYKLRKEMQGELKRLQAETGITFVFVTHDQEEALALSDRMAVMQTGQIAQLGTPREIYHHPESRYVADFIGDTNFLDAAVRDVAGETATVTLGAHAVPARLPAGARPAQGAHVTVAIRPEHSHLVAEDQGTLAGTVRTTTYQGTDTHVDLDLDSGTPFTVRVPNSAEGGAPPAPGTRFGIQFAPGALQVLRD